MQAKPQKVSWETKYSCASFKEADNKRAELQKKHEHVKVHRNRREPFVWKVKVGTEIS